MAQQYLDHSKAILTSDRSNFKGKNEGRDSEVSIAVKVSLENGKDPIFQLKGGL